MSYAAYWKRTLRVVLGLFFVLYPFLIYFGLQRFSSLQISIVLCLLVAFRFFIDRRLTGFVIIGVVASLIVLLVTLGFRNEIGLFIYPLLVNLGFFSVFMISYFYPPTVIERFARLKYDGDFPERSIAYMRAVTLVWCAFFVINSAMIVISFDISREFWVLYTGFISYLLIAILFAVEYMVRRKKQIQHHAD